MYSIEMRGITKKFGTFCANSNVDLLIKKGEIHALLGENGAGKTTLMNVLYGIYGADEGEIFVGGKKMTINSPRDAIANGIGMVHQHFMLVQNFTVAQNIVLGMKNRFWVKLEQVENAADFLIQIMTPMFIPAAVGLMDQFQSLRAILLPFLVINLVGLVVTFAVTGRVTQFFLRREKGAKK